MITKAVIPAAGRGTRFLPQTKVMPKEMLPIVDQPAIQYVVEEAAAHGLNDILIVTGRGKDAIIDHFDRNPELERELELKLDKDKLQRTKHSSFLARLTYTRQYEPKGLGDAVYCARTHVGDNAFAVLLGDDLIDERDELLDQMKYVQKAVGGTVIAVMEVPADQSHLYGCVRLDERGLYGPDYAFGTVTDVVEKPTRDKAPSNYAVIGRYILPPAVFEVIDDLAPGYGGEIQLTDALKHMSRYPDEFGPTTAVVFRGRRYDTGDKLSWLKTNIEYAMRNDAIRDGLADYIAERFGVEL